MDFSPITQPNAGRVWELGQNFFICRTSRLLYPLILRSKIIQAKLSWLMEQTAHYPDIILFLKTTQVRLGLIKLSFSSYQENWLLIILVSLNIRVLLTSIFYLQLNSIPSLLDRFFEMCDHWNTVVSHYSKQYACLHIYIIHTNTHTHKLIQISFI